MTIPFRQIHLDFHTSEAIAGIGKNFSKKQFQEMLQLGHVSSVNVFSKCHHGWAYHPSEANEIHPELSFDLLGEMIDACKEIGVKTQIYLSAGLDEKVTRRHPEWLIRHKNEQTTWATDFVSPGYHPLCFNSPYLDYFINQVEEVIKRYDTDGLWIDIAGVKSCYCQNCIASIRAEGKDFRDEEAMQALWERTYANYTRRVQEAVDKHKPGLRIFHNGGHIRRGRRDLAHMNTHLELESLPTGEWGYDHFPLSIRYAQNLDMECLGMTGKFHTQWGEFGGYKHPNALRYESSLAIANGAKCCIGDQLHPEGLMDEATYALIGEAYKEVEEKEAWCDETVNVVDIALLSLEAMGVEKSGEAQAGWTGKTDTGAVRMLLEGKYLFNVIDLEEDFSKYKVIILPDQVRITDELERKLEVFFLGGGKVLATGQSGLKVDEDTFAIDLGVQWLEENPYQPDYFHPHFSIRSLREASYVFYGKGEKVALDGGTVLGHRENPYFNRDVFTFCSHKHTPSNMQDSGPGMVESKQGIYFAWRVFEDYATKGSLPLKECVCYALDRLLGKEKTLVTSLPAQGIVTLMDQEKDGRYVNHLLYGAQVRRGEDIEIIEDILPIYDVKVDLQIPKEVKRVYLAPQMEDVHYEVDDEGVLHYTVPKVECHQMVVVDYR